MSTTEHNFFNDKPQALVTGSTGFLGGHLIDQLLKQDWKVYALCRCQEKAKSLNPEVTVIYGDVTQVESLIRDVPTHIDAIFHTAASTNTWSQNNHMQTRTNVEGMQNLIDLCNKNHIKKFIHVSSVVVYGVQPSKTTHKVNEKLEKHGRDSWINYVKTKTQAEDLLLAESQIHKVIVNPTHIIGPGDKNNWARLLKMIAHENLPSIPNGAGSFVDVRDVAKSIITAFEQGTDGQNYLLGGTNMDFTSFIHHTANKLDVLVTRVQLPNFLLRVLAKIKNGVSKFTSKEPDITPESVALISDRYSCDSQKAIADLNHSIRNFDETIDDTLDYLKSEKLIP